ncbi:hypothetical protein CERZMDRAFT_94532 [Cercospora zeae-maydis SCOH1-5]|uniref:DUF7730 domain-containing protein n=1 Tax=Cercospora zeae-maydis SCOH1-5 TaxID=717836 RepID=A0A6A6FP46_9PEZI|nr:hypothetical protein CERZMDRAFT_94532 [Cercospora zeae-maydis SCOH1-5]
MKDILSAPTERDQNLQDASIPSIPAAIGRCLLLELPPELRNNIYEFLFEHVTDNMLSTTICLGSDRLYRRYLHEPQDQRRSERSFEHWFSKDSARWPSKIDIPIVRTCKSIYAEAGPYHSSRLSYYFIIRGEEVCNLHARIAEHAATWQQHLRRARSITLQIDLDEGEKHHKRSEHVPMLIANLRVTLLWMQAHGVLPKVERLFIYEGHFRRAYGVTPRRRPRIPNELIAELEWHEFRKGMAVHVNPVFNSKQHQLLKDWLEMFGGELHIVPEEGPIV